MQITGHKCKVCGQDIVLSREGKFCDQCDVFVHYTCDPRSKCGVCGRVYREFEPAKLDPSGEAIVPRVLRTTENIALAIIVLGAFFLIAAYLFNLFIEYALAHGH